MSERAPTEDRLRDQRDRFVAFAFAGADLLLEVAADHTVSYAAGASERLCAVSNADMLGRAIDDFVQPADRFTLTEALRRIAQGGRFDSLKVSLAGPEPQAALISGLNASHPNRIWHLAISRLRSAAIAAAIDPGPQPGVRIDTSDFVTLVQQRLKEGEDSGEDYNLTLLDLSDAKNMSASRSTDFFANVEGFLRAHSVGGTSVGRLRDDKFGIITDHVLDQQEVQRRICDIAQEIDPDAPPLEVHSATVDMDDDEMAERDLTKALVYTINKFVAEGGETLSITSLAEGYRAAMDDTLQRVAHFREVITSDKLLFVYQPIVNLTDWSVHHFEALARIRQGDQVFLPSTFITFAEDVGVVTEMDMVVCRRAIQALKECTVVPEGSRVAFNLSGRSMGNPAFIQALLTLLTDNIALVPRLLFEITESSEMRNLDEANRVVQKMRGMGCQVCLDDFGAGAAAFQYLRALEVDFVKIDGSYILDAFDTHYGKPFLKAMASLCADMGIKSIGEMVEDEKSVALLNEVGIGYGQGYYFSRPLENVAHFVMPPLTDPAALRAS